MLTNRGGEDNLGAKIGGPKVINISFFDALRHSPKAFRMAEAGTAIKDAGKNGGLENGSGELTTIFRER